MKYQVFREVFRVGPIIKDRFLQIDGQLLEIYRSSFSHPIVSELHVILIRVPFFRPALEVD